MIPDQSLIWILSVCHLGYQSSLADERADDICRDYRENV